MKTKNTLEQQLNYYLAERRRLGFALRSEEARLRDFARYVDRRHAAEPITVELMAHWAKAGSTKAEPPLGRAGSSCFDPLPNICGSSNPSRRCRRLAASSVRYLSG